MSTDFSSIVSWRLDGHDHCDRFAVGYTADSHRVNLCVEAVPDGTWDWTVWRADAPDEAWHGAAVTLLAASKSAERAFAILARITDAFLELPGLSWSDALGLVHPLADARATP